MNDQIQEFQDLLFALIDDAEQTRKMLDVWPTPFTFRIYARTVFALFEGSAYGLKQAALSINQFHINLGGESFFTEKETSDLQKENIAIADSMKLGIKSFSKAMGTEGKIDFSGTEWQTFQETIQLRKQIAHPKSKASLNVSSQQLNAFINSSQWFQKTLKDIIIPTSA